MFDAPLFPVNLVLAGRSCLVVGGGQIATRKAEGLLACGAIVAVIAPEVTEALAAMSNVSVDRREFRRGDCEGHWFVVAATDDPAVNALVAEDAAAHRVWINAADDPANCTATLSAVHRQGHLTVAVSTAGRSPAVASWLRDRIAADLGPDVDRLIALVADVRDELRAAGHSTEGLGWRQALDSDMLALIHAGQIAKAKDLLHACLSSSSV